MVQFRRLTAPVLLLTLTACASQGSARFTAGVPSVVAGGSPYGLFLAGQSAIDNGDGSEAAGFFQRAMDAGGGADAPFLRAHTFGAELLAGDVDGALAIAPIEDPDVGVRQLAELTVAVAAMAKGQGAKARSALFALSAAGPPPSAARLLAPFAALQSGDAEEAISLPVIDGDPVAAFFASIDQGLIFERLGRFDEAETTFRALIARGDPGGLASLDLGRFLERRGRDGDAVAIYDQALDKRPLDSELLEGRSRAASHGQPPAAPSLLEAAANALTADASAEIVRKRDEAALSLLRLALHLDPHRAAAWLMVGDILSRVGDVTGAQTAWQAPNPGTPDYVAARTKLAWSYQEEGRKDDALAAARATLAAQSDSKEAATTLADLLRADKRYEESTAVLDRLIATEGENPDWRLLYMRAVDYQEDDRWPLAERDLTLALKQRPNEPELLNFLGYSWIDRGENLRRALAMVQQAVDADPSSGAMMDSLGWGYYRLGDYKTAVAKLEEAVSLDAGDPDVNNHLGDAYWRVGRRVEARYQWNRVLTLDPDPKLKAQVEAKLRDGLDSSAPLRGS